ncbi:phenylacetate--CoA ligase family protein [Candidatus Cloacimonadota bacterium]
MEKSIYQLPLQVLSRRAFYRKSQFWTIEQLQKFQLEQLKKLLIHSGKNVLYYRELFRSINFDPSKFENLDQMKSIPLLDKETVRTRAKDLLADSAGKFGITWDSTSGSTGTPLHFVLSDNAQAIKIAALLRSFGWAGYRIGMKTFCAQSYYFKDADFKFNRFYNILRFDSNRLSKKSAVSVMKKNNQIKPKFYLGFPFDLLMLAKYAEEEGVQIHSPKSIVTYGETLSQGRREQLEKYYKCKVHNFFSMHEGSAMISECEKGNLHLIEDFAFHEIVEDNGNSKLVGTNFYNYSMPLIRYDIKDSIIPSDQTECTCGRKFRTIKEIQGKACDFIQTSDGRILGAVMSHSIDNAKGVICSQIIQSKINEIIVKTIVDETYNENSQNVLEFGLRNRLGNEIKIVFQVVNKLEKRPGGKTPFILSKIGNEYN